MQESKKLTPQQIKERRRQKILQRAAKQKKQQSEEPQIQEDKTQKQSKLPPQSQQNQKTQQKSNNLQAQFQQGQQNAFQRFNEMLRKQTRDKMMKLFSKIIGFVVALVHVFFMYNLWTYHNKKLNKEINQAEFQFIKNKFQSENNLVFFAMLAIIYIIYFLIKTNKSNSSKAQKQKFQILPGSTIVQILQKLNKVLGYKIFLQFLASYITAYIITVLITGQVLSLFGGSQCQWFYWNLNQIYNPLKGNQDILL